MTAPIDASADDFLALLRVPAAPNIYVLGSYARYVTLYSQQVRALNLISALEGQIGPGTKVCVIGGGAAGLTASAAAALLGADVTLLERLSGLMELQRNNRQRWIHPHIYDWPLYQDSELSDRAGLPILDWKADYADRVADQIVAAWQQIQSSRPNALKYELSVQLQNVSGRSVTWSRPGLEPDRSQTRDFDHTILAVGFGLEPDNSCQWSYWEEDDVDSGLVRPDQTRRWLISGTGDSALTDLMRLCLKRFRHAELPELFRGASGLTGAREDLKEISRHPEATTSKGLTKLFDNLNTHGLEAILRDRRRHDVEVFLSVKSRDTLYDRRASVLNRFILRLLTALEAYRPIDRGGILEVTHAGRTMVCAADRTIQSCDDVSNFSVRFESESSAVETPADFTRVLLRHATSPKAIDKVIDACADLPSCTPLEERWTTLYNAGGGTAQQSDVTSARRWSGDFLSRSRQEVERESPAKKLDYGVTARSLTAAKELFNDGRAVVKTQIEGLRVDGSTVIREFRLRVSSTVGVVGGLEYDGMARELLKENDANESLRRDSKKTACELDAVCRFKTPLTDRSTDVSFGWTIQELNADALSAWEFAQFYGKLQTRLDGSTLTNAEYFQRIVWFPLDTLILRLTLPPAIKSEPTLVVYETEKPGATDVVDKEVLNMSPRQPPNWKKIGAPYEWRIEKLAGPNGAQNPNDPTTWELSVTRPVVGTCYSVEFGLPDYPADPPFAELEDKSRSFRKQLLRAKDSGAIRQRFLTFVHEVLGLYGSDTEPLEITLMSYDEDRRELRVVEDSFNGGPRNDKYQGFSLSFGFGLAGSAFKRGRAFIYVKPDQPGPVEYYQPIAGHSENTEVLLSIPLDHPDANRSFPFDAGHADWRSRQCVGVVNVYSEIRNSMLRERLREEGLGDRLPSLCRELTRDLRALH
jgi:hypothetical protein